MRLQCVADALLHLPVEDLPAVGGNVGPHFAATSVELDSWQVFDLLLLGHLRHLVHVEAEYLRRGRGSPEDTRGSPRDFESGRAGRMMSVPTTG